MEYRLKTGLVLLALLLASCSVQQVRQLDSMKESYTEGDYQTLAGATLDCAMSDESCAQRHLIKGHACLKLAFPTANGLNQCSEAPVARLQCARSELTQAIPAIKQWQGAVDLHQQASNHGLFAALYCLREQNKGSAAEGFNGELLEQSRRYLSAQPGDAGASYYQLSARLSQLRPRLLSADTSGLCAELAELQRSATQTSAGDFAAQLDELRRQIRGFKTLVDGCSN